MEQQIVKLLSQREFTRALNMYRACERDGHDRHFVSEAFFSDFIQSAARVGKADVVERLLRTMHRNGVEPSLTFWQTNLKLLSSRKHFNTLLVAYNIFDRCLPADKVVYSCLINAALDCEQASVAAHMLDRYSQAGLQAKDYVLHFRTYAAIADSDAAEALFRRLAQDSVATTLMLNLTILAFVNSCQTQRAEALLADIAAAQSGLADAVSYNTLIKGFAQMGDAKRCFGCLRQMRACGTQPDDVTLTSLVDVWASEGDSDESFARLAEVLMGTDGGADAPTCALFIRGLVRTGSLPKALEVYKGMQSRLGDSIHRFDLSTYSILALSTLIPGVAAAHQWDRVLALAQQAFKGPAKISLPAEVLSNALRQMQAAVGLGRHATQLEALMRGAGVPMASGRAAHQSPAAVR